jgi:TP901 family phage tail tape measure protein
MAMDLFSLVGKIAVEYSDAEKSIEKIVKAADDAADSLEDVDDAADDAGESIDDAGDSAKGADGNFSTWKATLANLASNVIQSLITKCTDLAKSVVDLGQDFTSMMSEVQAISGATDEEMAELEKTAREFGSTTVFSATDAAEALKYMSLAGWSAEQSTSALGGVLDLAAASGMGLGEASDMVTDYLSAFGMEADKSAYFADMLAYAQSNSNTTAAQLGEAYRNCAANLNAAGQDVETTTSLLEAMANQGYKGSEAGTALAAIMRDITNAMDDGAIQIGDTTVSVMDANGNFRDLTDILTDVEAATDGMGDAERAAALSSTFTADSTKGLNLILNEGMDKISGYEDALRSADGTASDMADTMNDNLSGDLANMNSAFEELKLKIFDGLENPLRSASQFVTNTVIPALTTLVENFDKIAPVIAGVTAALVTFKVAMGISSLVSAVTTAFQAYQAANEGATVAQWLFNAALNANPIVLIVTLIAGLVAAIIVLWNTNEDFRNGVIAVWEAIKSAFGTAIEAICTFFSNLWETVSGVFTSIWETIQSVLNTIAEFISSAFSTIVETVSGALQSVADWFSSIWNSITEFLSTAWETIKNVVQVGIMFIVELITAAFELITLPFQFIWENCKEYILAAWEAIKTAVSNALNAISTTISNVWNAIVAFLSPILEGIKNTFTNIWNAIKTAVTNVVNAIKTTISNVFNAVKTTVTNILNSIKTTFSNVWNSVKTTVSNVVNGVKSTISSGLNSAKSTVSSILESIKSKFSSIFEGAKTIVSNAIDKIKSFFNFSWSLPSLKLPHFSISGSFSLSPPSVPHFSIDWYKKAMEDGMVMNQPTIFGYNAKTNQFMAGGEAGSETVVGTDSLMEMIRAAVSAENEALIDKFETLISILGEYFPAIIEAMSRAVVLDSGALVGELAPALDEELGLITIRKGR